MLAGLVILGSLMWLLPSPAERRRMALRQQALAQGVRVKRLFSQDLPEAVRDARQAFYLYYRPVDNDLDERIRHACETQAAPEGAGGICWLEWGPGYVGMVWNEQPPTEAAARQVCKTVLSLTPRPPEPPAARSCD